MNYNSVILAGVVTLTTIWWFVHARTKYEGPNVGKMVEANMLEARKASRV